MKISIIIPAYNEEKRIGKTLEEYSKYFKTLKKNKELEFEIVVVINNTKDKTEEIVKSFVKKNKEITYLNFEEGGKGFAITQGFKDALTRKNDLIGFIDADMSTSPEAFHDLIKNIGNYDGVIANRWHRKSVISPKQTLVRRILSRGYNFIIRSLFLLPYEDTQCGAKIFGRKLLQDRIHLMASSQWGYDVALLLCLKKGGAKIKSIPTKWEDKEGSKINVKRTPIMMFLAALRLRLVHSPLRGLVDLYDKLPEGTKVYKEL